MADPIGEGEPRRLLLASQDLWSEHKLAPSLSSNSTGTLCPHIFSCGNSSVAAPNGNIYIISPHTCTCQSEKAQLYLFSPSEKSFIPVDTYGGNILQPYVHGCGFIDDGDGCIVVFASPESEQGDGLHVYSLDLKTKRWIEVAVGGSAPSQRNFYSAVMVGSKFFVFGGWDYSDGWVCFNDVWVLDFDPAIATPSWQLIEPSTSQRPPGRGAHICVSNGTHLIIFGGWLNSGNLNDVWSFDLKIREWTNLQCSGPIPSARYKHAGRLSGNVMYTFGGVSGGGDLWALELTKRQWYPLTAGHSPGARVGPSMICTGGKIFISGGLDLDIEMKSMLHVFDIGSMPNADLRKQSEAKAEKDDLPPQYSVDDSLGADSSTLSSLLLLLRAKRLGDPISSVVNTASVDLMRKLLGVDNYLRLALHLDFPSEIETLVEFALYLLDHGSLPNPTLPDANHKARRLIRALIVKLPFVPKPLLLSRMKTFVDQKTQWEGIGDVVKGDLQGKTVVLKLLLTTVSKNFYRGLLTWGSVRHNNILSVLGIYEEKGRRKRYLVLPAIENGTLSRWRRETKPTVEEIQKRILQVARGLQYLHSEGVVHGDICGSNICLDSTLNVKITNFAMLTVSEKLWSPNFAAPELFSEWDDDELSDLGDVQLATRTPKSDVYAFGCLYYEIHFDTIPFDNVTYDQLVKLVTKRHSHPAKLDTPVLRDESWKLMRCCWRSDPRRRPTMEDIVGEIADWDTT